jgi:hypothetical protein
MFDVLYKFMLDRELVAMNLFDLRTINSIFNRIRIPITFRGIGTAFSL